MIPVFLEATVLLWFESTEFFHNGCHRHNFLSTVDKQDGTTEVAIALYELVLVQMRQWPSTITEITEAETATKKWGGGGAHVLNVKLWACGPRLCIIRPHESKLHVYA